MSHSPGTVGCSGRTLPARCAAPPGDRRSAGLVLGRLVAKRSSARTRSPLTRFAGAIWSRAPRSGRSSSGRWTVGAARLARAARLLGRPGGGGRGRVRPGAAVVAVPGRQARPPAADRAPVGGVLLAVAAGPPRLPLGGAQ